MFAIRRILCPVDLSDASRHALDHAIVLAAWYGASITVLHVYQPMYMPVPGAMMTGLAGASFFDEGDIERLRAQVHAFVMDAEPGQVPFDIVIDSGSPALRILEQASARQADILVLGTHGLSGFEHMMVGSVTEKVLRKAPCPVLTVPPRAQATSQLPFKRLICPVDFSEAAVAATRTAAGLAGEAKGSVLLVHVLEGPEEDEAVESRPFNVTEYRLLREQDAATRLAALIPDDAKTTCEIATRVLHGKPYREILRLAELESSDLIVMGVHGRNPIDLALFGSTTNHVVRRARCPVLTLRAQTASGTERLRRDASEMISLSA